MKKLIIILSIAIGACTATQKSRFDFVDHEIEKGQEPGNMVVIKNGEEKVSETLTQPKGFVKAQQYLLMAGTKIYFKDIKAYQDYRAYHAFLKDKDHKAGIFVDRLRFAKINLYMEQELISNGPNTGTRFFYNYFFNKGNEQIAVVDYNTFQKAIANNTTALDLLHNLFPGNQIKYDNGNELFEEKGSRARLLKIVELYNE